VLLKSRLGNGEGTVRLQVRTYDRAGTVATTIAAAQPGSNPEAFMRVNAHSPAHLAMCCAIAAITACASQRGPDMGATPSSALGVMTESEIFESRATTAYDAIAQKHPMFLVSKVDLAPNAEREVYLNGVRLGGLNELRLIPAKEVKEIRFVRAIDGAAFGVGRSGGAILVISKAGR
jgi:hypothetical protein